MFPNLYTCEIRSNVLVGHLVILTQRNFRRFFPEAFNALYSYINSFSAREKHPVQLPMLNKNTRLGKEALKTLLAAVTTAMSPFRFFSQKNMFLALQIEEILLCKAPNQ